MKQKQPHELLIQIYEIISDEEPGEILTSLTDELTQAIVEFHKVKEFKQYKLSDQDVLLIAILWDDQLNSRHPGISPTDLLGRLYSSISDSINDLPVIVKLLNKQVFYTQKKIIKGRVLNYGGGEEVKVEYTKQNLLEHDVSLHRDIVKILLNEFEDIHAETSNPYKNNREFVSDWFSYIEQIEEFSFHSFTQRKYGSTQDESAANDLLKALEWKKRIVNRTKITNKTFPMADVVNEYNLDENENIILMYLLKEEMENNRVDEDDVIKLISADHQEMYQNKSYISEESKLVRNGIVEISENIFFMGNGGSLRISPDITRQIIMKTPINDEERLHQILSGNDIFTLLDPSQTIEDLVLESELKQTITTSLEKYDNIIDDTLNSWGLYNGGTEVVGSVKTNTERGLLMLLHGPPGTGKTFSAGAIANSMGKKLLVTDISKLNSKWVGDSEKNVRRLFTIFERIVRRVDNPPVLLLNEADQFLSKRYENANTSVESMKNAMQNLFLEAFENLKGIMIATTNLRTSMDPAFSRRFHLKLELPKPEATERQKLWKLHLPKTIPGAEKIDTKALATRYKLTGGQIDIIVKNATTEAATRKGKQRKLLQTDLNKYCELEIASTFENNNNRIGFS
ncbi:MAG: ATP-binding protein [Candidatus Marinimicrobia bacterium]|nr:ATP-binding protein [Candidatus Neomarinimicrobiota bacterium]MBL7022608.1 ATP-binding protein [Candidatus Neomarinimicrobiota bacterium]